MPVRMSCWRLCSAGSRSGSCGVAAGDSDAAGVGSSEAGAMRGGSASTDAFRFLRMGSMAAYSQVCCARAQDSHGWPPLHLTFLAWQTLHAREALAIIRSEELDDIFSWQCRIALKAQSPSLATQTRFLTFVDRRFCLVSSMEKSPGVDQEISPSHDRLSGTFTPHVNPSTVQHRSRHEAAYTMKKCNVKGGA